MPGSDQNDEHPAVPDEKRAAEDNPKVDIEQVREAQALLEELRRQGLVRPEYEIASPYERRPLRSHRSKESPAA